MRYSQQQGSRVATVSAVLTVGLRWAIKKPTVGKAPTVATPRAFQDQAITRFDVGSADRGLCGLRFSSDSRQAYPPSR
jgi:hypothetical protein